MRKEYNSNERFNAKGNPPVIKGTYAVKRKNNVDDVAAWDGENWSGLGEVKSYSGMPALLTEEERTLHRSNIRAVLEVTADVPERKIAQESAIKLARHFAIRMSRGGSNGGKLSLVKSMVAMFRVARTLGASFVSVNPGDAEQVDRALFAWGNAQIEEKDRAWFARTESQTENLEGIRAWLDER